MPQDAFWFQRSCACKEGFATPCRAFAHLSAPRYGRGSLWTWSPTRRNLVEHDFSTEVIVLSGCSREQTISTASVISTFVTSRGTCAVDCVTAHFCGFCEDLDQKLSSESTSGQLHSAINIATHTHDTCFETCPADPLRTRTVCVVSEFDIFASSTDNLNIIVLDHLKMNVAFVGNNEHFDNEIWCHCVPELLAWYLQ